ncbi:MAG: tetratricopeptide repeat 18, partial [Trebouxia sp. A1-2]
MAPKKAEIRRTEDEGPKVYLKLDVSWHRPLLASNETTVVVAYTFPGEREAVQSEPVAADTPSAAGFTRTFVRKQGLLLLHQLLNSPLLLKLLKGDGSTALASASLDFAPLAQGVDQFSAACLKLSGADDQTAVAADAAFTVQLLQETGTPREDPLISPGKPPAKGAPTAPPPGIVDLSQLTLGPCTLVPSDQAAGAQVVQLHLQSAGPLPDTLQAAATAAAVEANQPLYLELARFLAPGTDTLTDPAFEAYHGLAAVPVAAQLSEPGQKVANLQAVVSMSYLEGQQAGSLAHPGLPRPDPPANPKAKPIEEAPAASTDGSLPPCAWAKAQTTITAMLQLQDPLYPPWQPPPMPAVSLQQLIPKRQFVKAEDKPTASQVFQAQLQTGNITQHVVQMFGAEEGGESTTADPHQAAARRKQLVFELNKNGQYLRLKEQLKAAVIGIVKDSYHKSGGMGREEMQASLCLAIRLCSCQCELYNKLYMHLATDMHMALNQLVSNKPSVAKAATVKGSNKGPEGPTRHQLAVLKGLADEAELTGDQAAAERYHQERTLAPANPQHHRHGLLQVWYDYGTFCLRTAKQGQAEQCLKEAVAIEPGHKAALLALAALLWHVGLHTDAAYLDQAETVLHAAKEAAADDTAVWALLSLVYESMAPRRLSEHRNAAFEMRRLGKVHNRRSLAGNPYLQVALLLLDLQLGECAQQALQAAGKGQADEEVPGLEMALCCSKAASLTGDATGALEAAKEAARAADPQDVRPRIILGNLYWAAGRASQASKEYQGALRAGPTSCPLDLYLRLGTTFLAEGEFEYARNVYVQACAVRPCASTWLGAGIAYLRLQDYDNADVALMEANVMNNRHAEVWGYLALLALHTGQAAEAEQATMWALRCELCNTQLLDEIGEQCMTLGRYDKARDVLRQSLVIKDTPHARWLLGDALCELGDLVQAQSQYQAVQSDAATTAE